MKKIIIGLLLAVTTVAGWAQEQHKRHNNHEHPSDSTDVFFRHMSLNEVVVTGVAGETKLKHSTAPISIVSGKELRQTTATNIVDAITHLPGVSQITTGGGISKPIIRGLGYNRIIVMNEGIRQEGQQWGDEHGGGVYPDCREERPGCPDRRICDPQDLRMDQEHEGRRDRLCQRQYLRHGLHQRSLPRKDRDDPQGVRRAL